MRPIFLLALTLFGISASTLGQGASSDPQTLQAILTEVRALRRDLQVSLNRAQNMQILLARFQMQEGVITRASDRLNDARQKLFDTHIHQKEMALEVKRLEEALNAAENPQQQAEFQDRINHVKSDLEVAGNIEQQQQTTELQAQQQLREEQDRLSALEGQLDEIIRTMRNSNEKSSANHP